MAKLTLTDLVNLSNDQTTITTINANSAAIELALEKTLSRDGTLPNQMGADLDMNSFRVMNLPLPVSDVEPVRKGEFDDALEDIILAQPAASTAIAAAAAAAASYDSFDDRYLGPKASDPTLDNDGNVLLTGAIYFNTVTNQMRAWTGSAWVNVYDRTITIGCVLDGGGSVVSANTKRDLTMPFGGTILSWTLLADVPGSIVVNVWKDTFANYPPTVADKITASAPPTISPTSDKATSSTLTGWTTTFTAGDTFRFNVDSVATIKVITLALTVLKSL